ncbi:hypothetical protein, partial [Prochlorothrix hollandica]|uniref:hypothetical protein n=1 Tax=Prochlorothrix hollandica TaxID=1223 RepID=UPI001CED0C9B
GREKGSQNVQSPSPVLGEGFRVRAAPAGCTPDASTLGLGLATFFVSWVRSSLGLPLKAGQD